jgi:hypothetical protein
MVKYLDPVPFIAGLSVMIVAGLLLTRITRYPSSQRPHRLRAAVVELGCLADDDGPGARTTMLCRSVRPGIYRYSRLRVRERRAG